MRVRMSGVSLLIAVLLAGCGGGKKVAVNPAMEPTALLYPFEPIPIPAYEGMGMATHRELRVAQEMARSQAMADLGSNIFDTVSMRVSDVISSRGEQASLLNVVRNLSTSVPLAGKKFVEYRVGQKTGTIYCRIYMAKSEIDDHMMARLVELSQHLIDKPIRDRLTKEIAGSGAVNADVQSLTLFHEQQLLKGRSANDAARMRQ